MAIPKGTHPEWAHKLTYEDRAKGAIAATKVREARRKEARQIAEIIRAILEEPAGNSGEMTRAEAIARRALKHAFEKGTLKDLETLQKLLGESVTRVDVSGDGVKIVVNDQEQAEKLAQILGD